jgi:hypothetical protein
LSENPNHCTKELSEFSPYIPNPYDKLVGNSPYINAIITIQIIAVDLCMLCCELSLIWTWWHRLAIVQTQYTIENRTMNIGNIWRPNHRKYGNNLSSSWHRWRTVWPLLSLCFSWWIEIVLKWKCTYTQWLYSNNSRH